MIAVSSSANQQHKSSPQRERHIYGSSRLGMDTLSVELIASFFVSPSADGTIHTTNADDRVYELTNHLGNVLATFTARKLPLAANGVFTGFSPHVTSLTDYYPFGSGMAGRRMDSQSVADTTIVGTQAPSDYRYGFNTQEKDDEIYGPGNSYSAEFWQYDARLGRRWNLDPKPNPSISFYATLANNPILFNDLQGDTVKHASFRDKVNTTIGRIVNPEFRETYKVLSSSEEVYRFAGTKKVGEGGNSGKFSYNGQELVIEYTFGKSPRSTGETNLSSLYHETTHGLQFERGELAFRFNPEKGKWSPENYDMYDEVSAFSAQYRIGRPAFWNSAISEMQQTNLAVFQACEDDKCRMNVIYDLTDNTGLGGAGYRNLETQMRLDNQVTVRIRNEELYARPHFE
jgi:hypothetical protein